MYRQFANKKAKIIYNQFDTKKNNILSHGAHPWHINKDYDFLTSLKVEDLKKENKIVWVTSNQRSSNGHNVIMDFLDNIKDQSFVELYGRGIKPIDDKWDVLQSAKYAIAYENYQNDIYWTEKIVDCFLCYTMPIYVGCNLKDNFYPKDSFIQIDPKDKHIHLFLKELANSNKWEVNLESIKLSRDLALNEYLLFPFLYNQIKALESIWGKFQPASKEFISIKGKDNYFDNYPNRLLFKKKLNKFKNKIKK